MTAQKEQDRRLYEHMKGEAYASGRVCKHQVDDTVFDAFIAATSGARVEECNIADLLTQCEWQIKTAYAAGIVDVKQMDLSCAQRVACQIECGDIDAATVLTWEREFVSRDWRGGGEGGGEKKGASSAMATMAPPTVCVMERVSELLGGCSGATFAICFQLMRLSTQPVLRQDGSVISDACAFGQHRLSVNLDSLVEHQPQIFWDVHRCLTGDRRQLPNVEALSRNDCAYPYLDAVYYTKTTGAQLVHGRSLACQTLGFSKEIVEAAVEERATSFGGWDDEEDDDYVVELDEHLEEEEDDDDAFLLYGGNVVVW